MKGIKLIIIFGIIFYIIIRFIGGVYIDDEFGDTVFFIKHRPVWKWRFYSPRGMSDLKLYEMTSEQKQEQIYFDEFVLHNKR